MKKGVKQVKKKSIIGDIILFVVVSGMAAALILLFPQKRDTIISIKK